MIVSMSMSLTVLMVRLMVMAGTVLMPVMRMVVVAVRVLVIGRPGHNGLRDQRHPGSAVFA
jgi:hypothetical protein